MNERFELISRVPSKFYLAYGSNLDMDRMGRRCPYAVPVGVTEICGYRLLFKKSKTGSYATIEQDANESVPAVVWKLSEYDERLLDRYEGFPRYYYKKQFQLPVWNMSGNRMKKPKTCMAPILRRSLMEVVFSGSWLFGCIFGRGAQMISSSFARVKAT